MRKEAGHNTHEGCTHRKREVIGQYLVVVVIPDRLSRGDSLL